MKKIIPLLICICFFFSCSVKEAPVVSIPSKDSLTIAKDSVKNEGGLQSEITCPKCGFKKKEIMPTDVCLLKYTCQSCRAELFPKEGDCCVFCTYGTYKCPSKQ